MVKKVAYCLVILGLLLGFTILSGKTGHTQGSRSTPSVTPASCANLLENGGAESSEGWNLAMGSLAASYVRESHTGNRSLLLGPSRDERAFRSWSTAWQSVTLPEDQPLTLTFWYRPEMEANAANDRQYATLLNEQGQVIRYLLSLQAEQDDWQFYTVDLAAYAGRTVSVYFGVENDGVGGSTRLFVDDVQLCDSQTSVTASSATPPGTGASQTRPNTATIRPATAAPSSTPLPTETATAAPSATPLPPSPTASTGGSETRPNTATTRPNTATAAPSATPLPPSPTPAAQPAIGEVVDFNLLNFSERTLRGPFDSANLLFNLPADWHLTSGARLELELDTFLGTEASPESSTGSVEIAFNNVIVETVRLDQNGPRTVVLSLPDDALLPTRQDGQHQLQLALDSGQQCDITQQTSVVVRPNSRLVLPHDVLAPPTDLSLLPRPIFQQSFLPDSATLIVPDDAGAGELQAALSVAAGFGQLTSGQLALSLVPASALSATARENTHLIFVGRGSAFPILDELSLPAPRRGNGFDAPGVQENDGVVQMALSPWNPARVVLVVSGASEAAVIKAGQAVSTGEVRSGPNSALALVAEVRSMSSGPLSLATDRTLAEMGYLVETGRSIGTNWTEYRFHIPPELELQEEAYFDLRFSHSTKLDYERSEILISLNDQPIGSVRLNDENAQQGRIRLPLPRSAVVSGSNRLVIQSILFPLDPCLNPRAANLWLTLDSESLLHLPLEKPQGKPLRVLDLARYSSPSKLGLKLDQLAFVLPPSAPVAWAVAAQVAFDLGDRAEGRAAEILALFGDEISPTVQQRDLIIVGRPSTLPLIAQLAEVLPAPFEPGQDLANENKLPVVYRLPERSSLGYLELAPAPWGENRAILTVLGSTEEGVRWAGNALTTPRLRGRLEGDLALVAGEQITPVDTRAEGDVAGSPSPNTLLTLEQVGFKDRTLRGPFDSAQLLFNLPAEWELTQGAEVQIDIDTTFGGAVILPGVASGASISPTSAGLMEVSFNGAVVDTVTLDREGARTLTISIPPEALLSPRRDRQHQLRLSLDSSLQCNVEPQGTVLLYATSRMVLPHRIVSPPTALQLLPRPIYQGSFITDTATLVVPDDPTAGELQAALSVAAGFGRLTNGKLQLTLHSVSELTSEARASTHLIFVGRGAAFPMLDEVSLPAPFVNQAFESAGAGAEDGVVQMALSPWNPQKVVLAISGASEEGVLKAAGAVSTGVVREGSSPSLAVITEVQEIEEDNSQFVPTDRTLGELGYLGETMQSVGLNWAEYVFYMPPGMKVDGEGYFELHFNHTAKLDYARSELLVRLNDEPIGSVRLSDETAQQGVMKLYIPPSVLRAGDNRLSVQGTLMPSEQCVDPRLATIWLTVRPESRLHLPLISEGEPQNRILDMSRYGSAARLGLTLDQLAFVLPAKAPAAWQVAARVAFDLGHRGDGAPASLLAAYSDNVSPATRMERSLIVVGQPSTLPLITELHDALPAAFEPGSDVAVERNMRVIYEVPSGSSLGYLELLASPWNRQHTILAVLGSTAEGLTWAGEALIDPSRRGRLSGNFAVINGEQIVVGDTRLGGGSISLAATVVPGGNTEAIPPSPPPASERLWWIPPLIGTSIFAMIVIVAAVGLSWWRRRRTATL